MPIDFARASRLDRLYARLGGTRQFWGGWGSLETLALEASGALMLADPATIEVRWQAPTPDGRLWVQDGAFDCPTDTSLLPPEAHTAHLRLVLPDRAHRGAVCVQLAATSDEGFRRRHLAMAVPLAERGVASVLLESPYYGLRRPVHQKGPDLQHFVDLLTMARTCIEEARALVGWLRQQSYGPIVLHGVSMGGHLAVLTAQLVPWPVAVAPCIAPHNGAAVYNEGLLGTLCAWDVLADPLGGVDAARQTMRDVFAYTDVRAFPCPVRPDAAVVVGASRDGFVPRESAEVIHRHLPGARLRWLDTGHVGAFLFHRRAFLRAVLDALDQLRA